MMNIQEAIAYWRTIPDERWGMGNYWEGDPHDCGSVGCALGHLAAGKVTKELRMVAVRLPTRHIRYDLKLNGQIFSGGDFAELGAELFGISKPEARYLFKPVTYTDRGADISEKAVFFNRLAAREYINE